MHFSLGHLVAHVAGVYDGLTIDVLIFGAAPFQEFGIEFFDIFIRQVGPSVLRHEVLEARK